MRRLLLDNAAREISTASLDLSVHLAIVRLQRALSTELRYRVDQPRAPKGTPRGGQWVDDVLVAANSRGPRCDGGPGGCENGGSFGTGGMFNIIGKRLCWDCAVKALGLQGWPRKERLDTLKKFDPTYED